MPCTLARRAKISPGLSSVAGPLRPPIILILPPGEGRRALLQRQVRWNFHATDLDNMAATLARSFGAIPQN
jgi:hypothetical protein